AAALEEFEIAGVIDDAGKIRVGIVDPGKLPVAFLRPHAGYGPIVLVLHRHSPVPPPHIADPRCRIKPSGPLRHPRACGEDLPQKGALDRMAPSTCIAATPPSVILGPVPRTSIPLRHQLCWSLIVLSLALRIVMIFRMVAAIATMGFFPLVMR